MKRVLLAILALLLLAVVVGVSYIKTTRAEDESESVYREIREETAQEAAQYRRELDSVKDDVAEQQAGFLGALNQNTLYHKMLTDSLNSSLAARDSLIAALRSEAESLKAAARPEQPKKTAKKTDPDKKVADYYRQRFSSLPGDLSSYERKVAIGEIKSETADKFGISIAELDRIRKKYDIDY